uniref:Thioredoxin-like fold domain-containing protein n=1 Tax=Mycena chlorophos TaxID=658473 RepID=A0ABQ0M8S1_MYCCL|nr:predicted protein [Mycena chlorophos]
MRLSLLSLALFSALSNAQYFSEGWRPGQAVTAERTVPTGKSGAPIAGRHAAAPGEQPQFETPQVSQQKLSLSDMLDLTKLMNTSTAKGLFAKVGINITERLQAVTTKFWDERVPLLTDDNYNEMIVDEQFASPQEEAERVWCIIVSSGTRQEGLSKFFDQAFDTAYNDTLIAGDLPHVRFARIDYLNVTYITTKWGLWMAPAIVIAQDRGQTLRFYRAHQLRVANDALRQFLIHKGYLQTQPWSSAFAPGGSREFLMHYQAVALTKIYNVMVRLPRWALMLASGTIASFALNLFHSFGKKEAKPAAKPAGVPKPTTAPVPVAAPSTAAATAPSPSKSGSGGGAKQRKGKKK